MFATNFVLLLSQLQRWIFPQNEVDELGYQLQGNEVGVERLDVDWFVEESEYDVEIGLCLNPVLCHFSIKDGNEVVDERGYRLIALYVLVLQATNDDYGDVLGHGNSRCPVVVEEHVDHLLLVAKVFLEKREVGGSFLKHL